MTASEAPTVGTPELAAGRWAAVAAWAVAHRLVLAVGGMIAVYVAVFGYLTWRHHAGFGTSAFDMGIYDQGLWLLSRFRDPFVTVRGLDYFGHHANYATVLLVPAYWLGAGPQFLYLTETIVLALGAVPVWLLARDRLGDDWPAVGLAAAYLLHPAVGWINWWHFHPDALLITPLLFGYWFATRRRWGWFAVCMVLLATTKEDGALAVAAFGVLFLVWRLWRPALALIGAGAAWFLVTTRVLIPYANDGLQPLYSELFAAYGSSFFEIAGTMLRKPGQVLRDLTERSRLVYLGQLLAPVAAAPAFALPVLLIAAPQLLVNMLSDHRQTRDIHFHYAAIPVAVVLLATVEACHRVRARGRNGLVVGAVVLAALVSQVAWGPSPIGLTSRVGVWSNPDLPEVAGMRAAMTHIPAEGGVSAASSAVPHVTHRPHAYLWPHPFVAIEHYWGVRGSPPPDPDTVDYILVDFADVYTYEVYPESEALFARLTGPDGDFDVVFEHEGVFVAARRR